MAYSTRKYNSADLLDFQALGVGQVPSGGRTQIDLRLPADGKVLPVTGPQALLQRYLITLLTPLGSVPDAPEAGSTLLIDLPPGSPFTQASLVYALSFANAQVVAQLRDETAPPAERLSAIEIQELVVTGTAVEVVQRLVTDAGTDIVFVTTV